MKKVRTSDEIQSEINRLEWELKELREELYASNAINNPSYDEYKNKWVFYDAYENGWSYIYVLGVVPDDYLCFYGYGVDYDEQSGPPAGCYWFDYAEDEFLEVFFNIVRYSLPYFQWTTRDLEEDTLYLLEGAAYGFAYHGE